MTAKQTRYSWSKFCWDDWGNDGQLQNCGMAAQGLWINLLRLMFNSERQGYLQIDGHPMTPLQIAKRTGFDRRTIQKQLAILIENRVCSVDENGVVYSRRMVRENAERQSRMDAAKLQAGCEPAADTLQGCSKVAASLQNEIAENRQKTENPLYKSKNQNRLNDSPQTPHDPDLFSKPEADLQHGPEPVRKTGEVVPINAMAGLFTQGVRNLQERTRLSELECHRIVERWFRQAGQDAELVAGAIESGLHANNPVAYISAILKNRMEEKRHPGHQAGWQAHSGSWEPSVSSEPGGVQDAGFQRLSRGDQAVVRIFEKNPNQAEWFLTHLKNHTPMAYRYLLRKNLVHKKQAVA